MNSSSIRSQFLLIILVLVFRDTPHGQAGSPLTAVAFTPEGAQVLLGSQKGIELHAWPTMNFVKSIDTQLTQVHDLSFSPDGKTLLVAGGSPAERGIVEVFSWPSQEMFQRFSLHEDVVYRVAWSRNGLRWATASGDQSCYVIDAATGDKVCRYEGHSRPVLSLDFLQNDTSIVSVGVDQTLRLWNAETGAHHRMLDNHVGTVNAVGIRPESTNESLESQPIIVATISEDRTVRIWQPSIGRLVRFAKLASIPRTFIWSAAGDQIIVGCNDGNLYQVNFESMEITKLFDGLVGRIHAIANEPSGQRLLVAGETGFCIHAPRTK